MRWNTSPWGPLHDRFETLKLAFTVVMVLFIAQSLLREALCAAAGRQQSVRELLPLPG